MLAGVDDPRDAEAVCDHGESASPERLLQWHGDVTVLGECGKQVFRFGHIRVERDREALRGFVAARRWIGPQNPGVAYFESGVRYFAAPCGRRILGHGRIAPGEHERNLTVQATFVISERRFALAVE